MSGEEEVNIAGGSSAQTDDGGSPGDIRRSNKGEEARARVEDLSNSIPASTLVDGKSFDQLPLYEKKSALIDRELE